jgi:hypothetical protein
MAIVELMKSTMRTREYIESGEKEGKSLLDAMRDGDIDGMQHFDGSRKARPAGPFDEHGVLTRPTRQPGVALADAGRIR